MTSITLQSGEIGFNGEVFLGSCLNLETSKEGTLVLSPSLGWDAVKVKTVAQKTTSLSGMVRPLCDGSFVFIAQLPS